MGATELQRLALMPDSGSVMGSNPSGGVQQLARNLSGSQNQTQGQGDPAVRHQQGMERMAGNGLIDG